MFSNLKTLAVLGLCTSLVACGDKAKEVVDDINGKANELAINDQWSTGACTNSLLDVFDISSQKESYDFGSSASKTITFFREDNCAVPVLSVVESGSWASGNELPGGVYPIDITYTTVTITPLNDDGVKTLNTFKACQREDWQVNVGYDVTAQTSDTPMSPLSRCWYKPTKVYDITKQAGDELKFGLVKDGKDKKSPEARPTEIDNGVVLRRM